jgi:hypothetical protein
VIILLFLSAIKFAETLAYEVIKRIGNSVAHILYDQTASKWLISILAITIREFLEKGYFDLGDEFCLIPTGWTLEEELKDSITLRFFATFVPFITLFVDSSNRQVVMLQLKG